MRTRKRDAAEQPAKPGLLDLLTGNVGKLTGLLTAVAALVAAWQGLFGPLIGNNDKREGPCVEISAQDFPKAVKWSAWDRTPIRVKGRNTCDKSLGVFATFQRRQTVASFVLEPLYDNPQCERQDSQEIPTCWDRQDPVATDKDGNWEWEMRPPSLTLLAAPGSIDEIVVNWEVRNMASPREALASSTATITLIDDRPR